MLEDDNMDKFIAEQRVRLAHERESLEKNPTSAISDYILDDGIAKKPPMPVSLFDLNKKHSVL